MGSRRTRTQTRSRDSSAPFPVRLPAELPEFKAMRALGESLAHRFRLGRLRLADVASEDAPDPTSSPPLGLSVVRSSERTSASHAGGRADQSRADSSFGRIAALG